MAKYLFRPENLLLFIYVFIFWGFDLYLLIQGVDTSRYDDFYGIHVEIFFVFLLLPLIPYLFYYRLRKNGIKNSRVHNFYFPFSILLIIILSLTMRLGLSSLFLNMEDSHKVAGGFYRVSSFTDILTYCLLGIYIILQLVFIVDSFRMVRQSKKTKTDLVNSIGKE